MDTNYKNTQTKGLQEFLEDYERQTNTHNFDNVAPLICDDATYYFSDGTFIGIDEIRKAFDKTWMAIQNETYSIKNVVWVAVSDDVAVCTCQFFWKGMVNGKEKIGRGRGTNVLVKINNLWKIQHEHLSK